MGHDTREAMRIPVPAAPAVALEDVAQRLGRAWALRGVTLAVPSGQLVAIRGHNGSGKTTLLRVIATALRPTRGTGTVCGHDLLRDADAVRDASALLTHATGLYDDLTAAENLEFVQRMCGQPVDRHAILAALERVGMERQADQRVRGFSSGMRRRTAIARLYLRTVRVLLLDEPYNSLDADGVAVVDDLLTSCRASGGTALVVLHDLERGRTRFDRVIELREGRVNAPRHASGPGSAGATGGRRTLSMVRR